MSVLLLINHAGSFDLIMAQRFPTKNKSCFYMTSIVIDRCVTITFSLYGTSYNRMPFMKMTGSNEVICLKL